MDEMGLRSLDPDDAHIVRRVISTTWRSPALASSIDLAQPRMRVYHDRWGRPGDFGVVAERAGVPIGAAFARLFTEQSPGYGFVDVATPELGVAVFSPENRKSGLGTRLMLGLEEEARRHDRLRLSLSVNIPNPALHLYRRLGYTEIDRDDNSVRMVKDL